MENSPQDDPRVYFAAERTLLAWLRTGLGLMGVGFAVARFGLFLREMQNGEIQGVQLQSQTHAIPHSTGISVASGVALVSLGVVVNLYAAIRHVRVVHQLHSGSWQPGRVSRGAVALAVVLGSVGAAMAVYLLRMR